MADVPKKTKQTVRLIEAFLERPTEEIHGFDLIGTTKIKSGTLYPLLIRLENLGWLESHWEESDRPGPRRRLYRLSAEGEPAARRLLAEANARKFRPAAGRSVARPVPAHEATT